MDKYRITLAYEGTAYGGWQVQPNAITIQELLQKNIAIFLQEEVIITGAGRTDAGVHALGQVAHFQAEKKFDLGRFRHSINRMLPPDIRILDIQKAHSLFHARNSASGKVYYYHIHLDPIMDPFKRLTSLHLRESLDIELMKACAQHFIGTQDFTSFANAAHMGAAAKDAVRTIIRLDIVPENQGIRLEFEGDGFLYKMVRNITGTLIEVATGKRSIEEIPKILAAKDRRLAGQAAPAHGLFLVRVDYPVNLTKKGNKLPPDE